MKSKEWRVVIWSAALIFTVFYAMYVLGVLSFVSSLHNKLLLLLWLALTLYAVTLSWDTRKGWLHTALCVSGLIMFVLGSLLAFLIFFGAASRAVEYIASPNGRNTAVLICRSFLDDDYFVYPLRAKVFIRSSEGAWHNEGGQPDTSQFVWADDNTLQFEDEHGNTQTVRF